MKILNGARGLREEYAELKALAKDRVVSIDEAIVFMGLRYISQLETNRGAVSAAERALDEVVTEWENRLRT